MPIDFSSVVMPDITQLSQHLAFATDQARINLGDERMILIHTALLHDLRSELVASLGTQTARTLLTRIGFSAGTRDAQLAMKVHTPEDGILKLLGRGGQLHALRGVSLTEPIRGDIDLATGRCELEFFWRHSFEDEPYVPHAHAHATPVCWLETGYASGYLSACMGKLMIVREVECRSMGFDACRVIARPARDWADAQGDLHFLQQPIHAASLQPPHSQHHQAHQRARQQFDRSLHRSGVVGLSPAYQTAIGKINRVATTQATVLLLGESGVGKSTFARLVHEQSRRSEAPFVAINCATIPETLVESELFGVERGAFTGAHTARPGRFELAEGGTLFLDEIATMPLTAQSKLLRVLETGQFERLGSGTARHANVRIIAATNEDLWQEVRAGRFREDLFFRLHVFPIEIPPLRQRKEDLVLLIEHFMAHFAQTHGRDVHSLTAEAMAMLLDYAWPGNIRELSNVIERAIILAEDGRPLDTVHVVLMRDLAEARSRSLATPAVPAAQPLTSAPPSPAATSLRDTMQQVLQTHAVTLDTAEDALVEAALHCTEGNLSQAAGLLGISRGQLQYRRKRLKPMSH